MRKILVATDFSERSDRALRRATLLARQFGAALELIYVVDDEQARRIVETERNEAESLLQKTAATLRDVDGVACEARVALATPFKGIVQAARELAPDLLVIGSHRRQVLRDVFIGTTAERTIRSVGCPVLMVNGPPAGEYRQILQTTDLSDASRDALGRLELLGIGEHARVSILYVFDAPALRTAFSHTFPADDQQHYLEAARRDATRELADFVEVAGLGVHRHIAKQEKTAIQHEVLDTAVEIKADLIVLSTHGRSGLAKMFMGSVTEHVLRTSHIDVLVTPPIREA